MNKLLKLLTYLSDLAVIVLLCYSFQLLGITIPIDFITFNKKFEKINSFFRIISIYSLIILLLLRN